jgi:hypothetical protein
MQYLTKEFMKTYIARFYYDGNMGATYFDVRVQATTQFEAQIIMESMHGLNHDGLTECDS